MGILRLLVAGAAAAIVLSALRDPRRRGGAALALPGSGEGLEEPVLGYDGMDVDTLVDWLGSAALDRATLLRVRAYEEANLARGTVLAAVDDLL